MSTTSNSGTPQPSGESTSGESVPAESVHAVPGVAGQGGAGGRERRTLARNAGLIGALTLMSRLLGLVREQIFAALLGAGYFSDAFRIAYRIPNLLRDLFAEGALSAAFVPTFTEYLTRRSREEANRLASRLMTLVGLLLTLICVLGMTFSEPLVSALAHGFEEVPGKLETTAYLARIMLPFLPVVSLAAVVMGMLNAEEKFGAPALAPSMFNLVTILCGVAFALLGLPAHQVAIGWSVAVLGGGAAQLGIQLPALFRQGFRFHPSLSFRDEGIRRIGRLMAPATIGLAAVQLNIFINTMFASSEPGAVSWLEYAFRLLYLPIGIFGVAIGTTTGTGLARRAAENDLEGMRRALGHGLRLVGFLTIPSTVGLVVLSTPIVRLLYERGRFDAHDTAATATALVCYACGLFAYAGVKVLAPAFYALHQPKVPLIGSLAAVGANIAFCAGLYRVLGYRGVALGTSAGAMINFLLLFVRAHQRVRAGEERLANRPFASSIVKMALASAVMAAVVWLTSLGLERILANPRVYIVAKLTAVLVPIGLGAAVYFELASRLGLEEAAEMKQLIARRLGRRKRTG